MLWTELENRGQANRYWLTARSRVVARVMPRLYPLRLDRPPARLLDRGSIKVLPYPTIHLLAPEDSDDELSSLSSARVA
jgi:hypothetical protein